jgi:hypothetical protein
MRMNCSLRLDVLPSLWFRNTWSWTENETPPEITFENHGSTSTILVARKSDFTSYWLY